MRFLLLLILFTNVDPLPQTVKIHVVDRNGTSGGSGVYIEPGCVTTARHVVKDRKNNAVTVIFPSGEEIGGKVVWAKDPPDLAVIDLNSKPSCEPLKHSTKDFMKPLNLSIAGYNAGTFKRSYGVLSSKQYNNVWKEVLGAGSRNGDSGGPVIDEDGNYAGTLWGGKKDAMFTPVSRVAEIIRPLFKSKKETYDIR